VLPASLSVLPSFVAVSVPVFVLPGVTLFLFFVVFPLFVLFLGVGFFVLVFLFFLFFFRFFFALQCFCLLYGAVFLCSFSYGSRGIF